MGTGETRHRPGSETRWESQPMGWTGSDEPYKRSTRRNGESGAGVGGGHSSDEGVDNRTRRSEGPLAEPAAQRGGRGICRKAIHPPDHVSEGWLLGRGANAGGRAECRASTARGRAVCGKTACTVLRGEAGDGAAVVTITATAPALYSTLVRRCLIERLVWWPRQSPYLLEYARGVGDRPIFDNHAVPNTMDRNTVRFHFLVRGGNP